MDWRLNLSFILCKVWLILDLRGAIMCLFVLSTKPAYLSQPTNRALQYGGRMQRL